MSLRLIWSYYCCILNPPTMIANQTNEARVKTLEIVLRLPETLVTIITELLSLHLLDLVQHLGTVQLVEHHHALPHTLPLLLLLSTDLTHSCDVTTDQHCTSVYHSCPLICTVQVYSHHKGQAGLEQNYGHSFGCHKIKSRKRD